MQTPPLPLMTVGEKMLSKMHFKHTEEGWKNRQGKIVIVTREEETHVNISPPETKKRKYRPTASSEHAMKKIKLQDFEEEFVNDAKGEAKQTGSTGSASMQKVTDILEKKQIVHKIICLMITQWIQERWPCLVKVMLFLQRQKNKVIM